MTGGWKTVERPCPAGAAKQCWAGRFAPIALVCLSQNAYRKESGEDGLVVVVVVVVASERIGRVVVVVDRQRVFDHY